MKKEKPLLLQIVSAIAEPAVTSLNHRLMEYIQAHKKRKSRIDAYIREPVSTPKKSAPKTVTIPKNTKKEECKPDSPATSNMDANSPIAELIPLENAIQSFLTSSKLDGYIDPFLELDIIKNCPASERIAQIINQILCIIRYLCKGDRFFCVGALHNMLEYLEMHIEDGSVDQFTPRKALQIAASAANSKAFDMYFENNPDEQWHHIYIIDVDWKIELADFIDWVNSAFDTQHYPCPDFLHHPDFLRLIHLQEEDDVPVWVNAINEIIKSQGLSLEYIDSDGDYYLLVLLNRVEANVFKGMLDSLV